MGENTTPVHQAPVVVDAGDVVVVTLGTNTVDQLRHRRRHPVQERLTRERPGPGGESSATP